MSRLVPLLIAMLAAPVAAGAVDAPAGALSCSGCHPTGKGIDTPAARLVGLKADDITTAMQAFRSGSRPATVMDRISKGFTEPETKAIAAWYAAQTN